MYILDLGSLSISFIEDDEGHSVPHPKEYNLIYFTEIFSGTPRRGEALPSILSVPAARRGRRRAGERRSGRPPLRHARPEPEQPGLLQLAPPLQREHHLALLLRLHLHRRQGEDGGHHIGGRLQRLSLPAQVESQGKKAPHLDCPLLNSIASMHSLGLNRQLIINTTQKRSYYEVMTAFS